METATETLQSAVNLEIKPSPQQIAVFDWADNGKIEHLNLVARAGCGKSSTLKMLVKHLHSGTKKPGTIFLGAYNKAIATNLSADIAAMGFKFPEVIVGTMHSAGFGLWRKIAPAVKVNKDKVRLIVTERIDSSNIESAHPLAAFESFIVQAVSLAKQRAFGFLSQIEDESKWYDLIDHFGLDDEFDENTPIDKLVTECIAVFRISLSMDRETIDFDDMILAPLVHNVRVKYPFRWVFVDELQDTNPARRALAIKLLHPTHGRLVGVGDPAQAIYGFTGADSDSMELVKKSLGSVELPLNVTYRCAKSIVRAAQRWVPDIVANDGAPEGVVRAVSLTVNGPHKEQFANEVLTISDVILCRNNKPLVEMAYSLIRKGIPCYVEGREIGVGLIKLINRWKSVGINALINSLTIYCEKEVQKYMAKGKEGKAEAIADQCETIIVLAEKCQAEGKNLVSDLILMIQYLFSDTPEGCKPRVLTLCSIHKSKGREWNRVYLLGTNKYQPSKYARKVWQIECEKNLYYVAVTRAKMELVEIFV